MRLILYSATNRTNYSLNEYSVPDSSFSAPYKPTWELDKNDRYTLAFDIGSNSMSLVIGADSVQQPIIVLEFHKDSDEYNSTSFIDHLVLFVSGILSKNSDLIRTAFIESPVYYKSTKYNRANSYSVLKQIQTRLENLFKPYKIPTISKPAVTWKAIVLEPLKGTVKLNKSNKEFVKGQVLKYYKNFLLANFSSMSEDSFDALGILYYLYSFFTGDETNIIVTKNSPRAKDLYGGTYFIDTPENIHTHIESMESLGYKVFDFTYCNELDIEDNIKSILSQSIKGNKYLYKSEININISTLKSIANFAHLDSVVPEDRLVVVGGWL